MVSSATSSLSHKFTKGSAVEVSTDEEGFKGVWFVARVIDPCPKKKPSKLYVEYHTLLDEDGKKPLREHVNLEFVRPSPPSDTEKLQSFELNDVVDAFYRDGWWTGVITRVLDDNSRVAVTFQNPPDLIEFGISELRVHQEWVGGKWVRPEKQRTMVAGLMYSKGERVEVSFDKNDSDDIWFPATVLEETGKGSFLVEYQCPGANGGPPEFVKVNVDFLHIRPSPPQIKDKNFVLLEKVDAYIDFGWWSGVITRELADSRYTVFFKDTNKTEDLNHSEIRPHVEWKDGNWISASLDVLTTAEYLGYVRNVSYNVGDTDMAGAPGKSEERTAGSLISPEKQVDQTTLCNEKTSTSLTSQKTKTKLLTPDTEGQNARPSKKLKESNLTEQPSPTTSQLNTTTPVDTLSEDTVSGLATSANGDTRFNVSEQPTDGDLPCIEADNVSLGKKARTKRDKPSELGNYTRDSLRRKVGRPPKSRKSRQQALAGGNKGGELANHTSDSVRKKWGRPPKSPMSSTHASAGDKKVDDAECTKENLVEKEVGFIMTNSLENLTAEPSRRKGGRPRKSPTSSIKASTGDKKDDAAKQTHVTLNLEPDVVIGGQAEKLLQIPHEASLGVLACQKQELQDPTADIVKEGDKVEGGEGSTLKRKRGRPRRRGKSPEASVTPTVNQQNGGVSGDDDMLIKDCRSVVLSLEAAKVDPSSVVKQILNDPVETKSKSSSMLKVPPARKEKAQNGKASEKQHERHSSSKRGSRRTRSVNTDEDPEGINIGKYMEISEKDNLPKEREMEFDQLPINFDDQPLSMWFEGMHSPKSNDASNVSKGKNGNREDDVMQSPVREEDQSLPFMKNTPLWNTIESMEAFCKIPQKPHFHPLESRKEGSREGLAIGYMVTFASVVDKTSTLKFDDPRRTIEDNLETLVELENHGFDVKGIRDRLTGLLILKDKLEGIQELRDQSKENESRINEINRDKLKIDERINEIDKQMHVLQEERELALAMKENKESEIASLESTVVGIDDLIKSVQIEFEAIVAAPW